MSTVPLVISWASLTPLGIPKACGDKWRVFFVFGDLPDVLSTFNDVPSGCCHIQLLRIFRDKPSVVSVCYEKPDILNAFHDKLTVLDSYDNKLGVIGN